MSFSTLKRIKKSYKIYTPCNNIYCSFRELISLLIIIFHSNGKGISLNKKEKKDEKE